MSSTTMASNGQLKRWRAEPLGKVELENATHYAIYKLAEMDAKSLKPSYDHIRTFLKDVLGLPGMILVATISKGAWWYYINRICIELAREGHLDWWSIEKQKDDDGNLQIRDGALDLLASVVIGVHKRRFHFRWNRGKLERFRR
jgi:hypothetical protein